MAPPTRPTRRDSASISARLLDSMMNRIPSSQEKAGDKKLERAREKALECQSMISQVDRDIIEERITLAREIKVGLDSKSGLSKFLHAREYRKAARDAYRFVKTISDRGRDEAIFSTSLATETIFDRVIKVAQPLYRCHLSCDDAFPSPSVKEEWVAAVWSEACARTGANSTSLHHDKEFADGSMKLLMEMKNRIIPAVEFLFGFDTSRTPDSISCNARLAQDLVTNMTFIYREPNFGGSPHDPYRHPMLQKAINIMWFRKKDDDGIIFHEHFTPMPIQAMALALTVIECCIDEWTDGTREDSDWSEGRYETVYRSHIKSLTDLRDAQGGDTLVQLQRDVLRDARMHAGIPPEPVTG